MFEYACDNACDNGESAIDIFLDFPKGSDSFGQDELYLKSLRIKTNNMSHGGY